MPNPSAAAVTPSFQRVLVLSMSHPAAPLCPRLGCALLHRLWRLTGTVVCVTHTDGVWF